MGETRIVALDWRSHHSVDSGSPTDELIAAARRGDAAAAQILFARLRCPLHRYLSGRLPQYVQAIWQTDDLVQEVCTRAWKRLGMFDCDSPAAFWGYLRTIARNLAIEICSREMSRRQNLYSTAAFSTPEDPNGSDITEVLERQELYERALELLDERVRHGLLLRLEVGASYEDVARELGVPSAEAARKALRRALDSVLARLGPPAEDPV